MDAGSQVQSCHPDWADCDRFALSAGHGSRLVYSLLHRTGYALSLDDTEAFRRWGSQGTRPSGAWTPAGLRSHHRAAGEGLANAWAWPIGEAQLAARYNRPGHAVIDHRTFVIVGDGNLMEGVAAEGVSLAGHLSSASCSVWTTTTA